MMNHQFFRFSRWEIKVLNFLDSKLRSKSCNDDSSERRDIRGMCGIKTRMLLS